MCSGCGNLIADKMSFVCHSTPHFDSTSREVSYSVLPYHTTKDKKSKSLFTNNYHFTFLTDNQTARYWEK